MSLSMLVDYEVMQVCLFFGRHTNSAGYGNIMYDRRVIRGSTYAHRVIPTVIVASLCF